MRLSIRLLFGIVLPCLLWSCVAEQNEKEVLVTSVSISQSTAEMKIGETLQLTVDVLPSNATDKNVIWASSKQSVATVTEGGFVIANAEGMTTITATAGGKQSTCLVSVSKKVIEVSSLALNITHLELAEGESATLVAAVSPDDAEDKTVSWESTNNKVVEVDQDGKVLAKSSGVGTIIAKAGSKEASCFVTVTVPVTSIEFEESSITMVEGESRTLGIIIQPNDATSKVVIWHSSNNNVVSISEGVLYAQSPGTATVTVSTVDGRVSAECKVQVTYKPSAVAIFLEGGTFLFSADIGRKYYLHLASEPSDSHLELEWFVSDKSIASIDGSGRDVVLTAKDFGTAKVTVRDKYSGLSLSQDIKTKIDDFYWTEKTGLTYGGCPLVEIEVGEEYQLHCSYTPDYATRVFRKDMDGFRYNGFGYSSPSYFSINDNGLIKGLKPGITHITTIIPVYKRDGSSDLYVRVK